MDKVKIRLGNRRKKALDATIMGDLAIHKTMEREKNKMIEKWSITHVKSGYRVALARTKILARQKCIVLNKLFAEIFAHKDTASIKICANASPQFETLKAIVRDPYCVANYQPRKYLTANELLADLSE